MEIRNQVVIVTGASEGIGESTARLLANHGAKVALVARSEAKLNTIVTEIEQSGGVAFAVGADMRNQSAVQTMIQKVRDHFGRIDILINNAGQAVGGKIENLDLDNYRKVIELNIFGVLYAMQAVIPIMREQGGGMILNISSGVSKMAIPGIGGYASTKYALNGITLTARNELAADNIRVVLVHPRLTSTKFAQNAIAYTTFGAPRPAATTPAPGQTPGQVVDTPEHVAERILNAIQTEPVEQFMA